MKKIVSLPIYHTTFILKNKPSQVWFLIIILRIITVGMVHMYEVFPCPLSPTELAGIRVGMDFILLCGTSPAPLL